MRISPVVLCIAFLLFLSASAEEPVRRFGPDPSQASWTVVPGAITQTGGKYPATNVLLYKLNCGKTSASPPTTLHPLDPSLVYTPRVTGAGVNQISNVQTGECTISFDLTTTTATPGLSVVTIRSSKSNDTKTNDEGFGLLEFSDPKASPTPSRHEVDVMWGLIGYQVCRDAFGSVVAKRLYCISLKIGNNSGYSIQLAGVGFRAPNDQTKTPNTPYVLSRAVAQMGSIESPRNIGFNLLDAGGLLMAGFTPYFKNTRSSSRWATGASIVSGPLQAAYNLVSPDRTVQQGNNLDDQAFREGKLIPNNTQIATVIFLDKQSVTTYSELLSICASSYEDKKPTDRYNNCINGGETRALRKALGEIVVVGDEIDYIQRIVVDPNALTQEQSPKPQILDASIAGSTLTITGTNLTLLPDSLVITGQDTSSTSQTLQATAPQKSATTATYTLSGTIDGTKSFTINASADGSLPVTFTKKH